MESCSSDNSVAHELVLCFQSPTTIGREMLYSEFEAFLEGVVAFPEFASEQLPLAYVQLNARLQVVACVFFLVGVNDKGHLSTSWNLPLQHMAESAGKGPNLGAGPIRLACRSQCPVAWHQKHCWDPAMDAGALNSFIIIREAVKRNRLGLAAEKKVTASAAVKAAVVDKPRKTASHPVLTGRQSSLASGNSPPLLKKGPNTASSAVDKDDLGAEFQAHRYDVDSTRQELEQEVESLRLKLAAEKTRSHDKLEALASRYSGEIRRYKESCQKLSESLKYEHDRNNKLKEQMVAQSKDYESARDQFLDQVEEVRKLEKSQLDSLKRKFERELRARIEVEIAEIKETLDLREVEVFYRDEQISNLRQEVANLRQEKVRLLNEGGDQYLSKLHRSGITFVTFQPGAGHITIPLEDAGRFMDSPTAYIAEKCFVSEVLYREWLDVYHHPICRHREEDGSYCATPLARTETPGEYVPGESDRCPSHSQSAMGDANIELHAGNCESTRKIS